MISADEYKDKAVKDVVKAGKYVHDKDFVPGYEHPVERDLFKNAIDGFNIGNNNSDFRNGGKNPIIRVLGCAGCLWIETRLCPHEEEVTVEKPHVNRICSFRLEFALGVHHDGVSVTYKRLWLIKSVIEAEESHRMRVRDAFKGEAEWDEVLKWQRLKIDALSQMIKQDEGSKVEVSNKSISPSQFQRMIKGIDEGKIVDAEFESIEELEGNSDKEDDVVDKEPVRTCNERILITGVPNSGKTTLSKEYGGGVLHTDDLIETHQWSELSEEVSGWFDKPYSVIEGVAVPRALRKWLANNPSGKPCDKLVWLGKERVNSSKGQITMGKGCIKVFDEIRQELLDRGVKIG